MYKIIVKGSLAKLVDPRKTHVIKTFCRIKDPKCFFDPRYKNKSWDGFIELFDKKSGTFPAGLVTSLMKHLQDNDIRADVTYTSHPYQDKINPKCLKGRVLYDHQIDACNSLITNGRSVVDSPTGSGKGTMISAMVVFHLLKEDAPILVVVPSKKLLHQTYEEFKEFIGDNVSIGRMGDNYKEVKGSEIIVTTKQTLGKGVDTGDKLIVGMLKQIKVLIVDECHRATEPQLYKSLMKCPAEFRYGFSGSPKKEKVRDFKLRGVLGETNYVIPPEVLIKKGLLAKPTIHFITDPTFFGEQVKLNVGGLSSDGLDSAHKKMNDYHKRKLGMKLYRKETDTAVINNRTYNTNLAKLCNLCLKKGRPAILLTAKVEHLLSIYEIMHTQMFNCKYLTGKDNIATRDAVLKEFCENRNFTLLASGILDEGVDIPALDTVILAGGGKSSTATIQRVGRGMRVTKDKNTVDIFDFAHSNNVYTLRHAMARIKIYREKKYKVKNITKISKIFK